MTGQALLPSAITAIALMPVPSFAAAPAIAPPLAPVASSPDAGPGAPDIVVTAERRSVSIQSVPIAISAFDGDKLRAAGVSDASSLNKLVSGLDVRANPGPGGLAIFIRGVGATPKNGLADQANAFSVDGISFSRPVGPDSTLFDIARVEVLKGPQGTLYGRNATSGAVNVITQLPKLDTVAGFGRMTLGNYGAYQVEGALNLPLGQDWAIRASGNVVAHDGYFHDGYSDQDNRAGRLHLYYEPSPRVSLLITLSGAQERGKGTGAIPLGPNPAAGLTGRFIGNPWDGPSSPAVDAYVRAQGALVNPTATAPADNGRVHNDIWALAATLNVDLGGAKWTALAGYRDIASDNIGYETFASLYTRFHTREVTAETRLASNGAGPVTWIVGGFYGHESMANQAWGENITGQAPAHPPFPPSTDPDYVYLNLPGIRNDSWALFGQSTIRLAQGLRVTGGLRYTQDHKRLGAGTFGFVDNPYQTTPFPDLVLAPGIVISGAFVPVDNARTFRAVTFSTGVEVDLARDSLLYANVRKGYHAGGLIAADSVGPYPTSYQPETLMAYALGVKNRLFDRRLTLNLEAYYWDYRNLQVETIGLVNCRACTANAQIPVNGATYGQLYDNAGKAHTYGLDADLAWSITRTDRFGLNLLAARGKYDRYTIASPFGAVVADGHAMAGLPHLTFTAEYGHDVPLANGGMLTLTARTHYTAQREFGALPYPGSTQPAYTSSDLELAYQSHDKGFRAMAFVRNLENGTNVVSAVSNIADPVTGGGWGVLAPPRTYGVSLSKSF
jgi:iron complex outermembrane recepter protein